MEWKYEGEYVLENTVYHKGLFDQGSVAIGGWARIQTLKEDIAYVKTSIIGEMLCQKLN